MNPPISRAWLRRLPWFRRLLGLLGMAPLPAYGYAFPIAALFAAIVVLVKGVATWPPFTKGVLVACVAGIGALFVSSATQNEPTSALIVHYLSMGLFVLAAVKVTGGSGTASHLLTYASLGSVLFFLVLGTENTSDTLEHLWKYGIAVPGTVIAMWLAVRYIPGRLVAVLVLAALGTLSMALGFRSHGLVCVLALIAVLVKGRSRRFLIPKALFAGVGVYLAGIVLPNAISAGVFGEAVARRTVEQTAQGASPLLAGRVEPPLSMAMIAEKPLLGWGNLDALTNATLNDGLSLAHSLGLSSDTVRRIWIRDDGRVSLHSNLFEGWATGGIVAAVLPALLLVLFVAAIIRATGRYSPLVVVAAIQGVWDVLFSTWGYNQAFTLAFTAVLCAWAVMESRHTAAPVASRQVVPSEKIGLDKVVS